MKIETLYCVIQKKPKAAFIVYIEQIRHSSESLHGGLFCIYAIHLLLLPHQHHPLLFLEAESFIESGQDTLAGGNVIIRESEIAAMD